MIARRVMPWLAQLVWSVGTLAFLVFLLVSLTLTHEPEEYDYE